MTGRNVPLFGIELEYSLLDGNDMPALGSGARVLEAWKKNHVWPAPFCLELGSFQVELNPGPWSLTEEGLATALRETTELENILMAVAGGLGYQCSPCAFVPRISQELLDHPGFFTPNPRYRASASHFAGRKAVFKWANGERLMFEGERAIACLNEIHMHVRFSTKEQGVEYFNHLNEVRENHIRRYITPPTLNGTIATPDCTTLTLFSEANGELDSSGQVERVSWFPYAITDQSEYWDMLERFPRILSGEKVGQSLDSETTSYFWVRLRNKENLRVEYRPMEMAENWRDRVRHLVGHAIQFDSGS